MTNPAQRKRATSMAELGALQGRMFDGKKIVASIQAYKPQATDVVITPYGKSGTTWTQQIFHTLRTGGDMDFDDISRVVPWIEMAGVLDMDINAAQKASPRGFKSHLSYDRMPKGAKYINVIRDPVDAAWSAFKFMEGWYIEPGTVSPDEFAMSSAEEAGYYHHFVTWWEQRHRDDVLYLVYEHMRQDLPGTISRIAQFSGIELSDELLATTLTNSSLAFMQQHKDRFDDAMLRGLSESEVLPPGSDSAKVRAGQSGAHGFGKVVLDRHRELWQERVEPVTGYASYGELISALESESTP